jgi:hypothetical protein
MCLSSCLGIPYSRLGILTAACAPQDTTYACIHISTILETLGYSQQICMHHAAAYAPQHINNHSKQLTLLTMALAGAKGKLEAARPMIGTHIAVLLLM